MNRLLLCIILLYTSQAVLAEKLYRWVEPDGSITFSPNPPPVGTDYKAVDAANNNAAIADLPSPNTDLTATELNEPDQNNSILIAEEHGISTSQQENNAAEKLGISAAQPENNATEIMAQPTPAVELQKLTYAPDTGAINFTPHAATPSAPELSLPAVSQIDSAAVGKKRRQCQDLNKRVLSLERRLRSPLKPVDMDNTVIAMVRYQRSYDQHCVE